MRTFVTMCDSQALPPEKHSSPVTQELLVRFVGGLSVRYFICDACLAKVLELLGPVGGK